MSNKGYEVVSQRPRVAGDFTPGERPKAKKVTGVRLYEDQIDSLKAIAEEAGIPVSQLIVQWVDEKINKKIYKNP